jgi:hypothetical protein
MAWLEIIEIRAMGNNRELLKSQLQDLINDLSKEAGLKYVKIYKHVMFELTLVSTFFMIQIKRIRVAVRFVRGWCRH